MNLENWKERDNWKEEKRKKEKGQIKITNKSVHLMECALNVSVLKEYEFFFLSFLYYSYLFNFLLIYIYIYYFVVVYLVIFIFFHVYIFTCCYIIGAIKLKFTFRSMIIATRLALKFR